MPVEHFYVVWEITLFFSLSGKCVSVNCTLKLILKLLFFFFQYHSWLINSCLFLSLSSGSVLIISKSKFSQIQRTDDVYIFWFLNHGLRRTYFMRLCLLLSLFDQFHFTNMFNLSGILQDFRSGSALVKEHTKTLPSAWISGERIINRITRRTMCQGVLLLYCTDKHNSYVPSYLIQIQCSYSSTW